MPDVKDFQLTGISADQYTMVLSHELIHALIELLKEGDEMHRKLHDYHGHYHPNRQDHVNKDTRIIMSNFRLMTRLRLGRRRGSSPLDW